MLITIYVNVNVSYDIHVYIYIYRSTCVACNIQLAVEDLEIWNSKTEKEEEVKGVHVIFI